MPEPIHIFTDGTHVEFGPGKFDDWCVYHVRQDGVRKPPRDIDYFETLRICESRREARAIYRDFVEVFELTRKEPEVNVFEIITEQSRRYGELATDFEQAMSFIYLGMIAEENKSFTKLGKRIKRLGVHKLLVEGESVSQAANFMKGMAWRDIDQLCRERDF